MSEKTEARMPLSDAERTEQTVEPWSTDQIVQEMLRLELTLDRCKVLAAAFPDSKPLAEALATLESKLAALAALDPGGD